ARRIRDRAPALHPSRAHARPRRRGRVSHQPRDPRLPAARGRQEHRRRRVQAEPGQHPARRGAAPTRPPQTRPPPTRQPHTRPPPNPPPPHPPRPQPRRPQTDAAMSARDLLFELCTEELPPRTLLALSSALTQGVEKGIDDAGLTHGRVQSFATPRRLG